MKKNILSFFILILMASFGFADESVQSPKKPSIKDVIEESKSKFIDCYIWIWTEAEMNFTADQRKMCLNLKEIYDQRTPQEKANLIHDLFKL